jgi:short-subunit dehydrogenase involved in D-alanine esterification of teichoic acids
MATANSKLAITGKPVWFITGCSTGIGRELAMPDARQMKAGGKSAITPQWRAHGAIK